MNNDEQSVEDYAPVLLKLLQSVLSYHDTAIWDLLMRYRNNVEDYFARMGLQLILNEEDGYAYLEQPRVDADGRPNRLPRLTRQRPLTFEQTLLAVLLRERLDQHDQQFDGEENLILSTQDIYDMMITFLDNLSDERKSIDQVSRYIKQLMKLGLLRQRKKGEDKFIVERVIKSRITSDVLSELKQKLMQQENHNE
ncbi:MAG: DUF4194 domain-containing protein [Chloroflexota bacterium]